MAGLVGAVIGAGIGLLYTAVQDLMQSGDPDPAKIKAVKDAQMQRMQELVDEGVESGEAYQQAKKETALAMEEAMKVTDNVTGGDYFAAAATGAAMGAIPFGAIAKGASKLGKGAAGKVGSFLERQGMTPKSRAMIGKTSDIRGMGAKTDIRGMGETSDIRGMGEASSLIGRTSPRTGAASSRRAVPVGDGVGSPHPMEGASSPLGKLRQADVWDDPVPTRGLPFRGNKTIDVTAERVTPRLGMSPRRTSGSPDTFGDEQINLGMADDATLNPAIDDIIDAAMGAAPKRLSFIPSAAPIGKAAQMERMRALRDLAVQQSKEAAWRSMGR
jgi:hypothetical protein